MLTISKTLLSLALILLMASTNKANASICYSPAQAEAEQGIRIHSELMVIGLNCQHMGARAGMNLYGTYRKFTASHADLFEKYENIMMRFYKKRGDAKPVASLNTLRTQVANKISNDAAKMRPDIFCATYAPRITKASTMSEIELRKWASMTFKSHPLTYPSCQG